ncbi:hypothetical protein [Mucilaginibacter myungsuensis]|uniref:Uncharacterized protein n=1 Tax=Mucilaginibacter myungsuensis TaxID=649104 RepID=A0A929KWU8_9SPHI|nr:hypothetical protein [Mucilaginibacter myungsuensis]MBE9661918.1 hypothetical protein [Mucilaginibacter myungsuensis]MDN3599648.1 hypothetical protein [Mucilaginibacter myungsuensis]
MPPTYKIGSSTDRIKITVNISADAPAATEVRLLTIPSGGKFTVLSTSQDATGDIHGELIGDHTTLKGKRLQVFTQVSIPDHHSEEERKRIADNVTAAYTLEHGEEGKKRFAAASIDFIDPNVFINFLVDPK